MRTRFKILIVIVLLSLTFLYLATDMGSQPSRETDLQTIEPDNISYTVTDVNPYKEYIDIQASINFNESVNITHLKFKNDALELSGKIIDKPSFAEIENHNHLTLEGSQNTINIEYRQNKKQNIKRDHRIFDTAYSFSTWPMVYGQVQKGKETYKINYDRSIVQSSVVGRTETESTISEDAFYINSTIASDGFGFALVDDLSSSPFRELSVEGYRYGNITYTVIDTTSRDYMNFSKIFRNSRPLFNKNNKYNNTIYILGYSDSYYGGGAIDKEDKHTILWVEEHLVSETSHTTVGHEVSHASQTYYMSDKMEWWIEGSAEYFGIVIEKHSFESIDREYISEREFGNYDWDYKDRDAVNQTSSLFDESSWKDKFNYKQGARVVYKIDTKIRNNTDGDKNIFDLHRWMQEENYIDYRKFTSKVKSWTSQEFARKLDDYLEKSTPININYRGTNQNNQS